MRVLTEHNDKMKEIEKVRKDLTGDKSYYANAYGTWLPKPNPDSIMSMDLTCSLFLGHQLLHEEMGSAADSLKRSISDTFTLFTDQVNLKIQVRVSAIGLDMLLPCTT